MLHAAIAEAGKSIVELAVHLVRADQNGCCAASRSSTGNWCRPHSTRGTRRDLPDAAPRLLRDHRPGRPRCTRALTVMYRPPRKAALKPLMEGARARGNLHLAPANLARRAAAAEGAETRRADRPPAGPGAAARAKGVWADFFGRPAYTMTLPAKLQQLRRAPIILVYAERRPRGAATCCTSSNRGQLPAGTPAAAGARHQCARWRS